MIKKFLWVFLFLSYCSVFSDDNSEDKKRLLWFVFYFLLNQSEPITIHCDEIPQNYLNSSISTTSENCSNISDPLFSLQWHFDLINLSNTWQSYCGTGVKISIIDDGLEISHEDLSNNIELEKSYNYKTNSNDPTGDPENDDSMHGTSVAGLIAAKDNSKGIRGVAPRSSLRALNAITTSTLSNIIDATTMNIQEIWVSNNSWGPEDGTGLLISSSYLWQQAIWQGLKSGRHGLGTIFVNAGGNGAYVNSKLADNSNYDGYVNFYGVTAICAIGNDEKQAIYSEKGANLWLCAPSMGNDGSGLVTTDLSGAFGYNSKYYSNDLSDQQYTKFFIGTSGSTPIVSGAISLLLQSNPYLSWRDVRLILAKSAKKNDPLDIDWTYNSAGFHINHKYGFGLLNIQNAIQMAQFWNPVGSYKKCSIKNIYVNQEIPDYGSPIVSEFDTSILGIQTIEWVDTVIHIEHQYFGDLQINLYSPAGTKAILAEPHNCFYKNQQIGCNSGNIDFRFGIARFLEETAMGKFRIEIQDKQPRDQGYFKKWDLIIYGR